MNVEYVTSRGEGTLIEHGVITWWMLQGMIMTMGADEAIMFQACSDDCETGQ